MLFNVTKPDPAGIYWLDDVFDHFFQRMFVGNDFGNDLFPPEFAVVMGESDKTSQLFKKTYEEYSQLTPQNKIEFQQLYANHRMTIQNLSDEVFEIAPIVDSLSNIWKYIKKLGAYLYQTTLRLVCFKNILCVDYSIDDHFEKFKELNGRICCFCALHEYEEEWEPEDNDGATKWRAAYDHYLPKKHYPLSSIDFNNLLPCCEKCNSKAKGEKDILFNSEGIRLVAFTPYVDPETVVFLVVFNEEEKECKLLVDDTLHDELRKKIENWNRIFRVLPRAQTKINNYFQESWLSPLLLGFVTVEDARDSLTKEILRCKSVIKDELDAFYKTLCYEALLDQDDEVLGILSETINQSYSDRAQAVDA